MATSTVQIPFTVTAATQGEADAIRDAGIVDYCKFHELDIYVTPNVPASGVDQAKALTAFRSNVRKGVVSDVKTFRGNAAAIAAKASAAAQVETEFNV